MYILFNQECYIFGMKSLTTEYLKDFFLKQMIFLFSLYHEHLCIPSEKIQKQGKKMVEHITTGKMTVSFSSKQFGLQKMQRIPMTS